MKYYLRNILVLLALTSLVGCGAPVTKGMKISDRELQQERQLHKDMVKKHPQKKVSDKKHSDLNIYKNRLHKVYPRLQKAAQQICQRDSCNFDIRLQDQKVLNAWADGRTVNITPVMLDFLESDTELALILAHELAHNTMGHISKKTQNSIIGLVVDVVAAANGIDTGGTFSSIGAHSHSQGFENEADYIAIYIMALAGYDISNVNTIWRKMSVQSPDGIHGSFFSSHPSNPERYLRMKKTIDEVKSKQNSGQKLAPNFN